MRSANTKTIAVEHLDDFSRENGLELLGIRILVSEVAENISAPAHHFEFFAFHRNISFSLFKRFLIRSISCFGVLIPCVDFF